MQIYKNPFKEWASQLQKQASEQLNSEHATRLFKHRTHAERHKHTNTASILLGYVCNILSGITTAIAISVILYQSLVPINHYLALITAFSASLVVIPIIEAIKRHSLRESLIDAIQYKTANLGLWAIVVLFCSISVIASYKGAELLPELTTKEPILIDVDSIQQANEAKIQATTVLHTYKPTNTLTRKGAQIIEALESDKRQAIEGAKAINEERLNNTSESIALDKSTFMGIAIAVELLFLVSFLFSIRFYWKCYTESIALDSELKNTTESNTTKKEIPHPNTGQRPPTPTNKIGFIIGGDVDSTKIVHNSKLRTCNNCGKDYTYKHWKQKFCSTECRMQYWKDKRKANN